MPDAGRPEAPPPSETGLESSAAGRPAGRAWRRWFDSWLRSLGVAFLLFLVIRTFFFEAFQIPSGSMERTLLVGDFLFVNKLVYGAQIPGTERRLPALTHPKRGDVVVFSFPGDPQVNYVKRVVAVGGDTVAMRDRRLFVNHRALLEPYAVHDGAPDSHDPDFAWQHAFLVVPPQGRPYRPTRNTWGPLWVPLGKYFVLGDNRDNSSDSRYWGFVDAGEIKGRPAFVYFSYDREAETPLPWVTEIRWDRLGEPVR